MEPCRGFFLFREEISNQDFNERYLYDQSNKANNFFFAV